MKPILIIIIIALLSLGCEKDYYAQVTSDTSWSGSFADRTVDGKGDKRVDIPDDPPQCVVVQKDTEHGKLSVTIFAKSRWFLGSDYSSGTITTTAAYGIVLACSE